MKKGQGTGISFHSEIFGASLYIDTCRDYIVRKYTCRSKLKGAHFNFKCK